MRFTRPNTQVTLHPSLKMVISSTCLSLEGVVPPSNAVVTWCLWAISFPPSTCFAALRVDPSPTPSSVFHFFRLVIVRSPLVALVPARISIPQTLPSFSSSTPPCSGKSVGADDSQSHVSLPPVPTEHRLVSPHFENAFALLLPRPTAPND